MRKVLLFALWIAASCASTAHALGIGITVEGGPSWPVLQDDRGNGAVWGVRVPVNLAPLFAIEPYYLSGSYGDKTVQTIAGPQTRDGGTVSSWGANLVLTSGSPAFSIYPFVGLGSNTESRASVSDVTNTGYNFGLGLGIGLPAKLTASARAETQMIVTGDVSRKFGNLTFGLTYHFLSLP